MDMFSGIGGFREGLRRAGGFECAGHCEQDEHAERSYRALFDTRGEWFCDDIRKADAGSMPDFELLCGGFPCQSFSIAGSRHGFADPRGTLFFELARVAEARKPQYLLFENVPGLLNHDGGRTFAAILDTLDGLGYINLGTDGSICGVQSITCPDGSVAYGVETLVFEVDRNGDYDFFVWDRCGNLLKYTVPVDSFAAPVQPKPVPSEPEETKPEPEPEPAPEPEGPENPVENPVQEDSRALTLADLACMLLSILFAALVWLRGKKDGGEDEQAEQVDEDVEEDEPRGYAVQKTVNAVLAVLSVALFFLTQPLVWRFRLVDWWTVLFVLLCGTALAMLIWKRKEENKAEETDEEKTEDLAE